jgi:hypothetical protein
VANERLADDGATERQSGAAPGSTPEADTASFKEVVPGMKRLQRPPRLAVEGLEAAEASWPRRLRRRNLLGKSLHIVKTDLLSSFIAQLNIVSVY